MAMHHTDREDFKKMLSKLKPTDRFNRNLYCIGNESPCRVCILKRLSKAQVTDLHEWEIRLGRIMASFEIARYYRISFHFTFTDREYVTVIEEINKQRPKRVEPRTCEKCILNFRVCSDYKGGDCTSAYTDIEYRHAWDWTLHYNAPKEMFMKESSSKRLIDQVENN